MDMNLSKLQGMKVKGEGVKDREIWYAVVRGIAKS